jgi:hypothetical protein
MWNGKIQAPGIYLFALEFTLLCILKEKNEEKIPAINLISIENGRCYSHESGSICISRGGYTLPLLQPDPPIRNYLPSVSIRVEMLYALLGSRRIDAPAT